MRALYLVVFGALLAALFGSEATTSVWGLVRVDPATDPAMTAP